MDDVKNLVNRLFVENDTRTVENVKFFLAGRNLTANQIAGEMTAARQRFGAVQITSEAEFDAHLIQKDLGAQ